jgi:NADH:ubiquinone oxidoreductase subunit K
MEIVHRRWFLIAIAVAAVAVAVAVALAPGPLYERHGTVEVPYEARNVYEVELLGAVTVYVDGKLYGDGAPRINANLIGSIALIMLATAALVVAATFRITRASRRLSIFYLTAAAALGLAGLDKLLAIHESVGHNMRFLADVPGVERPDDLILALYLVPVLAVGYLFRDVLAGDRRAAVALAIGVGFFALSAFADLTSLSAEKQLELVSGLFIAGGLIKLVHTHLRHLPDPPFEVTRRARVEAGEPSPAERVAVR